MSNLPLQPMTTAPRDGSEVLLVCSAVYASWGKLQRVSALWNGHAWDDEISGEHPDSAFVGWLDLDALVRDSERLALVILMFQDHEWVRNLAAKIEHPHDLDAWRAAIDKEMNK